MSKPDQLRALWSLQTPGCSGSCRQRFPAQEPWEAFRLDGAGTQRRVAWLSKVLRGRVVGGEVGEGGRAGSIWTLNCHLKAEDVEA